MTADIQCIQCHVVDMALDAPKISCRNLCWVFFVGKAISMKNGRYENATQLHLKSATVSLQLVLLLNSSSGFAGEIESLARLARQS